MLDIESVSRIEPARLEEVSEAMSDVIAELAAAAAALSRVLHPRTAENLASLVRIMNTYYSNLIEGHDTRPPISRAHSPVNSRTTKVRRDLQIEAAAHVRVQAQIDRLASRDALCRARLVEFIRWLHREFYQDAPAEYLRVRATVRRLLMQPGVWR